MATATLVLRRRGDPAQLLSRRTSFSSRQLGQLVGADPGDVAQVRAAAQAAGLEIVEEHAASRRLRVHGPQGVIDDWLAEPPEAVRDRVMAVLGAYGPCAMPRSIVASPRAGSTSYTPLQLADIYVMPDGDGSGQTIAIIELGGGFDQSDLDAYFGGLGLASPAVNAISVDGASNVPGQDPQGADAEVLLDIEVAGAIAPKATINVYFAPNTDAGFLDAVSMAAHANPAPAALSISWGAAEDEWSQSTCNAMDAAFADAVAMGATVTVAAGDDGSSDNDPSGGTHVDFPASSPHVLGCGGTSLQASGGHVTSETVWDDGGSGGATGGGVSAVFPLPDWQDNAGVPTNPDGGSGRGVPDIAAVADPQTGYQVRVDGQDMVIGGTSAVAPLWAGLLARIAQLRGAPVGLAQTGLYGGVKAGVAATHTRDITQGNNGAWQAAVGWDPCTGLGVPDAATAVAFGTTAPPAPTPTPSPAPSPTPPSPGPSPAPGTSVLDELKSARTALDAAIDQLEQGSASRLR
ncbi:MAG TPA: S53 family peptidase [Rhodanobacteraceae bacterium]